MNELPAPPDSPRIAVRLKQKAIPFVRSGHPWLFEDSIERLSRADGAPGDVAILYDSKQKVLGAGLYDPASPVRVKVLTHKVPAPPVGPELWTALIAEAKARRDGKLPSGTNAWRLIHGESDGFPGLVADKYAENVVLKVYSAALLPWLGEIRTALFSAYPELRRMILRMSRELQSMSARVRLGLEDGMTFPHDNFSGLCVFQENGIFFEADLKTGQKTGFFLDQRDNRAKVGAMTPRGASVLNVFSYSGGFSLYAARAGAKEVTSLDFNKYAIAACDRNFELNHENPEIAACRPVGLVGDAFTEMGRLAAAGKTYDVVIVDPPSFAKSVAEKESALHSYASLAKLGSRLVRKNGLFVFASCSSRVTSDELFQVVLNTAQDCGRPLHELERTAHAVDHPALFPESHYLKCMFARRTL